MADIPGERDHDPLARLVSRFRAILRKGVTIIEPSLRSDGHLEATIRLEDGRAGRFIVVFLDENDREDGDEHVLVVERATDRAWDYQPSN